METRVAGHSLKTDISESKGHTDVDKHTLDHHSHTQAWKLQC